MQTLIIVVLLIALCSVWVIEERRKLIKLNENVNVAKNQVVIQLASGFEVLDSVLEQTGLRSDAEWKYLYKKIKMCRNTFAIERTLQGVIEQKRLMSEAVEQLAEFKAQKTVSMDNEAVCIKIDAVESYEKMIRTSCLIHNDSVTKLNKALEVFPVRLLAGILGIRRRMYIEIENHLSAV